MPLLSREMLGNLSQGVDRTRSFQSFNGDLGDDLRREPEIGSDSEGYTTPTDLHPGDIDPFKTPENFNSPFQTPLAPNRASLALSNLPEGYESTSEGHLDPAQPLSISATRLQFGNYPENFTEFVNNISSPGSSWITRRFALTRSEGETHPNGTRAQQKIDCMGAM